MENTFSKFVLSRKRNHRQNSDMKTSLKGFESESEGKKTRVMSVLLQQEAALAVAMRC